ncbi:hypothetical protein, partial [Agreia sp.]|uniref:hypothetical protein n=1 Tax=Agreia sp. TaxID=1872416 RepID=UPI0035BBC31F
ATCMADEGYSVDSPLSDTVSHRDIDDSGAASSEEVAEALADITCKTKTKFIDRVSAIHAEIAQALITTHETELRASLEFNENSRKTALAITG